jgi:UDP-glucuronate 4-epimerase
MDFIGALKKPLGKEAFKEFLPIQPGDVPDTWANVDDLVEQFDYQSSIPVEKGVASFVEWFENYYNRASLKWKRSFNIRIEI